MSYEAALKAAGATVHDFIELGSYQGEWFAYVTYNGETGWVGGFYGSCSGCDAFHAEFGWSDHEKADYHARLKQFGETYLGTLMDRETTEKQFADGWYADERPAFNAFIAKCVAMNV